MRSPLEPTVQPQATNAEPNDYADKRFSDAGAVGRMGSSVQQNINKMQQSVDSLNPSTSTETPTPGSNVTSVSELGTQATTPTLGEKGSAFKDRPFAGLTKDEQDLLQSKYGYAYSLIASDPSLEKLFIEAIVNELSPDAFAARIKGSNWYQTHNNNQRAYEILKATGGADWTSQRKATADAIQKNATRVLGKTLTPEELDISVDEFLQGFGVDKVNDPNTVGNYVGKKFFPNGALNYGGSAATNGVTLNTYAKSMGLKISGSELSNYVSKIASGEDTIDNLKNNIRKNATNLYPQYSDRFDAGATFDDVMYPYIKTMEQLGFDVDNLDTQKNGTADIFIDPLLQKAAFAVDAKGNPAPMAIYNFMTAARKDKRWQYTDNAHAEYANIARDVIGSFGGAV